jgi:hypothetical protein
MYYNKITNKITESLHERLLSSGVKNPQPEHYEAEGWIVTPIQTPVLQEGYHIIPNTQRVVLIEDIPVYEYDLETTLERDERISAEEQANFISYANSLDSNLIEKYTTFYGLYQQTVQNIQAVNPNIPTNITYPSLVNALLTMEGEIWTKLSVALSLLWNDVVVASRRTPADAYELLPYIEFRRQNL